MPYVYLQDPLSPEEIALLQKEFPSCTFMLQCEDWNLVEIFYGTSLDKKQLLQSPHLQWIHLTKPSTTSLCLESIKENIIITFTKEENASQIAEFTMGAILNFAKQFSLWGHDAKEMSIKDLKKSIWSLHERILLQVGLEEVGSAIVHQASHFGIKTWGVQEKSSFHPFCSKTFSLSLLNSLLPVADIVVIALHSPKKLFGNEEFKLMKNDSIFILIESADCIDMEALIRNAKTGKFRGLVLDIFSESPSKHSPLREIPNTILTPHIASYPQSKKNHALFSFRKNLHAFLSGKIQEMQPFIQI